MIILEAGRIHPTGMLLPGSMSPFQRPDGDFSRIFSASTAASVPRPAVIPYTTNYGRRSSLTVGKSFAEVPSRKQRARCRAEDHADGCTHAKD